MKNFSILAAVAAGLLTGACAGARRPNTRRSHALVPLAASLSLQPIPAPPEVVAPIVYDAHFEEPAKRGWLPWCVAAALALALIASYAFSERPRFAAFAAPATVLAGSSATISYTALGVGDAQYTFDDGAHHRTGSLPRGNGAFTVPVSPKGSEVVGTLQMQGIFGTDARIFHIHVVPLPAPIIRVRAANAPAIKSFTLSRSSARGGEVLTASFQTNATSGNLRLADASGAVWLSRPIAGNGAVELTVPLMHKDTPFIAVLHAERNNQNIEASAGFVAQAKLSASKESHPMSQFLPQPAFTVPAVVHGGTAFSIEIPPPISGVTVALSSKDGSNLGAPASQEGAQVRVYAPRVSTAQQTFASVSFANGKERETVIRRILVVP